MTVADQRKLRFIFPAEAGFVEISWQTREGRLELEWRESGGVPLSAVPAGRGFGSQLIEDTIARRLRGTLERRWTPEGLQVLLDAELDAIGLGAASVDRP